MAKGETDVSKLIDNRIKGAGRLAGRDAQQGTKDHQGGGPRYRRRVEVGETQQPRDAGLVAQRGHLYG